MKKILSLSLLAITLFSCSTDDSYLSDEQQSNNVAATLTEKSSFTPSNDCFDYFTGTIAMDVSNGLNNPIIKFGASAQAINSAAFTYYYTLKLEIQPLADCEDMNSDTGSPFIYTYPTSFQGSNIPTIDIRAQDIPVMCYKWRMFIGRADGIAKKYACTQTSTWQDAPVY